MRTFLTKISSNSHFPFSLSISKENMGSQVLSPTLTLTIT